MPECCEPCPAAQAAPAPAPVRPAGGDGRARGGPCPCRTCCCGKPPIVKPCYKQPKIPDSYAPRRCYTRPTAKIESGTTYKMSYLPAEGKRVMPILPEPCFVASSEPMESHTVQKLSYLPNPTCAPEPCRPCHHDMWGKGPMRNVTTQKHDYVAKPCVITESFKPSPTFHNVEAPFENRTVNKLSYLPPEKYERIKSYAPTQGYEKPNAKMDCYSSYKMSYLPNKIMPKEPIPWACHRTYEKPVHKIETHTTYGMSYLDAKNDCRRLPIVPTQCFNPVTASTRFESGTVYKTSYLPAAVPVAKPVKPSPNIIRSEAPMESDTVQKLSYLPNPVCLPEPCRPCHHDMWGKGPMQNVTTQKHDYVAKPCVITESFKPDQKYVAVETPFENRTVNRLSYINPGRIELPKSFAPVKGYHTPNAKMDCETVHKMSYQPFRPQAPQKPPWADAGRVYTRPTTKLQGTTVYKSSFLPPGEDCSEYIDPCQYGDCKTCDCVCPSTCIATDPCACAFPRAECCG